MFCFFFPKGQNSSCQSLMSIQWKAESFKWKTIPSIFISRFKVFDSILSTPLMGSEIIYPIKQQEEIEVRETADIIILSHLKSWKLLEAV